MYKDSMELPQKPTRTLGFIQGTGVSGNWLANRGALRFNESTQEEEIVGRCFEEL